MKSEHPDDEEDTCISFSFRNGFIELKINEQQTISGWSILPHIEPCRVSYLFHINLYSEINFRMNN